jgi:hypothetical protein
MRYFAFTVLSSMIFTSNIVTAAEHTTDVKVIAQVSQKQFWDNDTIPPERTIRILSDGRVVVSAPRISAEAKLIGTLAPLAIEVLQRQGSNLEPMHLSLCDGVAWADIAPEKTYSIQNGRGVLIPVGGLYSNQICSRPDGKLRALRQIMRGFELIADLETGAGYGSEW